MTNNQYFVTHTGGICLCDSISRKLKDGTFEELSYEEIVNRLNKLTNENQQLRKELASLQKQ